MLDFSTITCTLCEQRLTSVDTCRRHAALIKNHGIPKEKDRTLIPRGHCRQAIGKTGGLKHGFIGGSGFCLHVRVAGNALHVTPLFPRKNSASPELGILKYHLQDGNVFIQMLRGGFDVSGEEIISRKQTYLWKEYDLTLEVMHPVLCLQEKVAAVCRREQRGRQDQKHLLMALQFVPSFIAERIADSDPLEVLGMAQRVIKIAEGHHWNDVLHQATITSRKCNPC